MSFAVPPLLTAEGQAALAAAKALADPSSLASASALRAKFAPELAAAAASQQVLRAKAQAKFGTRAADWLFTADGLEQATRPQVAAWRAERFAAAGVRTVLDLGCGIGSDLAAFADAGLNAVGVERDPTTAGYAAANVPTAKVICGDVVELLPTLLAAADEHTGIFIDPARRGTHGRTWRVEDFVPSWDFVMTVLDSGHPVAVKLGPGLPTELIPPAVEAIWVSHRSDVVEASLWRLDRPGHQPTPAQYIALLLPGEHVLQGSGRTPPVGAPGAFIHEPDGAVIRAQAVGDVDASARLLAPGVAYLTSDAPIDSPFVTSFEVLQTLPFDESKIRAWVKSADIGQLEIKKRAVQVDPAALRRRLKVKGSNSATILISPTLSGARVFVVRRVQAEPEGNMRLNGC